MIITCPNCNKKFEISSDLIPNKGRLLQCSNCKNEWFFEKNTNLNNDYETKNFIKQNFDEKFQPNNDIIIDDSISDVGNYEVKKPEITVKKTKNITIVGVLNIILVFIISISALVILLDTFKKPISSFIPNIEFILYGLYETLKDVSLFFKDLS